MIHTMLIMQRNIIAPSGKVISRNQFFFFFADPCKVVVLVHIQRAQPSLTPRIVTEHE